MFTTKTQLKLELITFAGPANQPEMVMNKHQKMKISIKI